MYRSLSSSPILEQMKREAGILLHGLLRRDTAALRRYYSTDPLAGLARPRLDDAQHAIAREHGYSSWQRLEARVNETSSNFQIS